MALTDKLSAIGDAIRAKTGKTTTMTLDEMPTEIANIEAGGEINNQNKTITENGTYTADSGYTGLGTVTVDVASGGGENRLTALLQNKITEITEADFGDLTSINQGTFYRATSIKKVTIPKNLTAIHSALFSNTEVEEVYAHDLPTWMGIVFGSNTANPLSGGRNDAYNSDSKLYLNNTLLTDLVIPNDITAIKNYSFANCLSLSSITIHEGVTKIGSSAFEYCVNVRTLNFNAISISDPSSSTAPFHGMGWKSEELAVNIGKMVEKIPAYFLSGESATNYPPIHTINFEEGSVCSHIGKSAFSNCAKLEMLSIPQGVSTIYEGTFNKCTSLRKIDFSNHTIVPTLSNVSAFRNVPSTCKVIVPDALYDEWVAATNWSALTVTYVKKSEVTE